MKAIMDAAGVITLSPESSIEAFALRRWVDAAIIPVNDVMRCESHHWRSTYLIVNAEPLKDPA